MLKNFFVRAASPLLRLIGIDNYIVFFGKYNIPKYA